MAKVSAKYETVFIINSELGEEAIAELVAKFKTLVENLQTNLIPKWLELNKEALSAKVVTLPAREDIDFPFEEQLLVELYSK